MDRNDLIEKAREFRLNEGSLTKYYPKMDNSQISEMMADFALSLFQFKEVRSSDDLPKVDGVYYTNEGVAAKFRVDDKDNREWWLKRFYAYIPIPLPAYLEQTENK